MGLAGPKHKQRIPADPRNLGWADDASRFGLAYLEKFGWDPSQGLGSSGDGTRTHLKVQQKLDMMGIGAQHQRDPDGIAWKQNKEFEALLRRLNETAEQDGQGQAIDSPDEVLEHESKKRKHKDASEKTGKKRKKDTLDPSPAPSDVEPAPKSRPMAHRARIRAAKRIAGKSASAISEILGIAPSSSVSTSTSTSTLTTPTSYSPPPTSLSHDNLTTSTKTVADYFKEKLARSSSSPASSSGPLGFATPGPATSGLGFGCSNVSLLDDEGEAPRMGIGGRTLAPPLLSQSPQSPAAGDGGRGTDDVDVLAEKRRRKAERKAERRKLREAETSQVLPSENGQMEGGGERPSMTLEKKYHKRTQKR